MAGLLLSPQPPIVRAYGPPRVGTDERAHLHWALTGVTPMRPGPVWPDAVRRGIGLTTASHR